MASTNSNVRLWKCLTATFIIISIVLLIIIVVVCSMFVNNTVEIRTCGGSSRDDDGDIIDLSEPSNPGTFHDLTTHELTQLRVFLERDRSTRASKAEAIGMNSSVIFAADLYLPPKSDVLMYLDGTGPQPPRHARVMLFRGDLSTPVIEERICGPLPNVSSCHLLNLKGRRNPAEYSLRPFSNVEFYYIHTKLLAQVDKELGYILQESYGSQFTQCDDKGLCIGMVPYPLGTGYFGDIDRRRMWVAATYDIEFRTSHNLNFGLLLNLDSTDVSKWSVERIWYVERIYENFDELIQGYNSSSIPKVKIAKPSTAHDLFSRQTLKGDPWPPTPKRPPTLVEPDGKRYKVKDRKVEYMDWSFHFRLSAMTGAALNDVRFKGERIVYDMGLQELAVFYSGFSPLIQTTNYVDSVALLGTASKALVPGGDCPDTATFINQKFMAQTSSDVAEFKKAICLFENNHGFPLRRHMDYSRGVYTGMLNSALTLRTAMTIGNYDYILDYVFHQNGVLETRWLSSGYLMTAFHGDHEKDYSFRMHGYRGANLHHHIAHFKVDLDVSGTSNRYETLDITAQDVPLTMDPSLKIQTTQFTRNLKQTELEGVYEYDFDNPKIHVVHNDQVKNINDEMKAYRIDIVGMSKQLRYKRLHNEVTIPWARKQMVMTKHKDAEFWSSSSYAMWDSADPVVDFSSFYTDNDNITDQDLVAWITLGMHHLPRTEDIPVTTTIGNHRTFLLMPFNYYAMCPSMRSRDAIRLTHKENNAAGGSSGSDEDGGSLGGGGGSGVSGSKKTIVLDRHGLPTDQCTPPKTSLDDDVVTDPDSVLETKIATPIF